jgi:hypothetical protein
MRGTESVIRSDLVYFWIMDRGEGDRLGSVSEISSVIVRPVADANAREGTLRRLRGEGEARNPGAHRREP